MVLSVLPCSFARWFADARVGRTPHEASLLPRHPVTGSPNFSTSRLVNPVLPDLPGSRARTNGYAPRRTSTLAPGDSSTLRRPSHHITARDASERPLDAVGDANFPAAPRPDPPISSIARTELGETTIGPRKRAWAEIGTSKSASTSGHTAGPPADSAYAVDPVGVAQTDRKSTRLNSSHVRISYAVFCLKKKKTR